MRVGIEIRNRWTEEIQFTTEIDCAADAQPSVRLALAVRRAGRAGAVLAKADLAGVNLLGSDLAGVNLSWAVLTRACLAGADLTHSNLVHADLTRAQLGGADLTGADLAHADLSEAALAGASLAGADLTHANLSCADLTGADFADATLRDAHLAFANLDGADLTRADLARAFFAGADLADANLAGADLIGANFWEANLEGANLAGADCAGATFARANLAGADLTDARNLDRAGSLEIPPQDIPIIPNIDATILAAIEAGGTLDMASWDRVGEPGYWRGTTHGRACWAIRLAGEKGIALSDEFGPHIAGALIYRASRPGEPAPWFFATTYAAMADIRRCAAEQTAARQVGAPRRLPAANRHSATRALPVRHVAPADSRRCPAVALEQACRRGDVPCFLQALERLGEGVNGWMRAMQRIAELPEISSKIRSAFLGQWGEHKWLSYRARHDGVVARGLRALLPQSNYLGPPLPLYRGAGAREDQPQGYGVSWTRRLPIARAYARRNDGRVDGSVVFETIAPPHAILYQRKYRDSPITEFHGEDGEDEEYVVDPSLLTEVKVVHRERAFICGTVWRRR